MKIGERIRQIRIHQGLTQTDLIKGICSNTYISKIESGKAKPSYAFILKISKVLDVDPDFLTNLHTINVESDVHRIYESYRQTYTINSQDLAFLKLHIRENNTNYILIKMYHVLISYYIEVNIKEAQPFVEQAKSMISDTITPNKSELSHYYNSLSRYFLITKNFTEALLYADLHLKTLPQEEGSLREAKAYFNLTTIRTKIDEDLELARIYSKKALRIFKLENYKKGIGYTLTELAIQYHRNGFYSESLEVLNELNVFSEKHEKEFYAPILEYNYGRVYQKQNKYDHAITHYFSSIKYDEELHGEEHTIYAIKCLAEIYIEQKNWEEANEYLKKGFKLTHLYHLPNMHIHLLHLRSKIYSTRFDFPSYEKDMQQAIQLAVDGKYPLLTKNLCKELASHYNEARAYKMAATYYQMALN